MITHDQFYEILNTVNIGVLAKQSGISRQALHKIKKKETNPSFSTMEAFSMKYEHWIPLYEFIKSDKDKELGLQDSIMIWKHTGSMHNMKPSNVCYQFYRDSEQIKHADELYIKGRIGEDK
jgi:hypothetical protein